MKETKPKRLRKGEAFREYLVVREEIEAMMAKGYDMRYIHTEFTQKNKITMAYKALSGLILKEKKKKALQMAGQVGPKYGAYGEPPKTANQLVNNANEIVSPSKGKLDEIMKKSKKKVMQANDYGPETKKIVGNNDSEE